MPVKKVLRYSVVALALVACLPACERAKVGAKKSKVKYEGPVVVFGDVRTLYSENALPKIKIVADRQLVFQNGDVKYPNGLNISMYNEYGVKTTTLQGDSGKYDKQKQFYEAYGNVLVTNHEEQQTLRTTQLAWDQPKREIKTEKPVTILTRYERLEGVGLVSDEAFKRYRIYKPTGVFPLEK
jgi:LPS export ABC transporter protein LptC